MRVSKDKNALEAVSDDTEDPSLEDFDGFGGRSCHGMVGAKARLLGGERVEAMELDSWLRGLRRE